MLRINDLHVEHVRLGVVLAPDGSDLEVEGVLNPGVCRDRAGRLLLFPRMVARGNVSRIGLARGTEASGAPLFERHSIVLEPSMPYELREGGHGCEDPRVTFLADLDLYVMTYTAFGEDGPRIAVAVSEDAYTWTRLGRLDFADRALNMRDNKDAAFFPEPVRSPKGEWSYALYHRPMLPGSVNGQTPIETVLAMDPAARETTYLAYVPVASVKRDVLNLTRPQESVRAFDVGSDWGLLKNGAGTPPIRTALGWLSFFHGVDAIERDGRLGRCYRAGILVHDYRDPSCVLYRSSAPVLGPVTLDERIGIVDDVVFPTGIDVRAEGTYDVYYGAADAKISCARFMVR